MSCDCYKIGGPWITYDPSCPAHGTEAQERAREQEETEQALRTEIQELREAVLALRDEVNKLKKKNTRFK